MKVTVNSKEVETQAQNLLQLSQELNLPAVGVALAVNQQMVPRDQWGDFAVSDGQKIVIIKAVCGG